RYEHANPVSLKAKDGRDHMTMNRDYAWGDCKIHIKYRSFHSIRAKSPYDNKWAKKAQGVETPLFEGILAVGQPAEEGLGAEQVQVDAAVAAAVIEDVVDDVDENVSHVATPSPHDIPSLSQEPSSPPQQQQSSPQAPPQDAEFPTQLQQVLNVCSALSKRVENLETDNAAQKLEIVQLKARVGTSRRVESSDDMEDVFNQGRMIVDMDMNEGIDTTIPAVSATILAAAPTVVAAYTRRRKGVIIRDPKEELSLKTSAETPAETPKIELDAEYARKLHEELNKDDVDFNKDVDWNAAMEHVNQNLLQILARFDENMRFLFKSREEIEEEYEEIIKSINETLAQKAAKRRKLNEEAQEVEAIKKQLEIVHDEDDDVFTEANPIGRKVHVVNYEIMMINNKRRYKIIRADDTHQLYISFITL
nr:hypothetical protein [Tanacetum cinerariifolium]